MHHLFIATINTPGYLPEGDPGYFFNATEAWDYLRGERYDAFTDADLDEGTDPTFARLRSLSEGLLWDELGWDDTARGAGSVNGSTPGYDGDHDLGLAYTVTAYALDDEPDTAAYAGFGRMVAIILGSNKWQGFDLIASLKDQAQVFGLPGITDQSNAELALWRILADEEVVGHDDDWNE
jgi:hypothetical protein